MKFPKFSSYLQRLEGTTSRIEITKILAELFKKADPLEIDKICYLSLGRLAPKFSGIEFNLAEKMVSQVLTQAYGEEISEVRTLFKKIGDLGDVVKHLAKLDFRPRDSRGRKLATQSRQTTTQSSKLSVLEVYKRLMEVAEESGEGSVERKITKMASLLKTLDPLSAKYIVRISIGKLRLGFSDVTILDSLSWMEKGDKSLRPELERAYNVSADIGKIAKVFKKEGTSGLRQVKPVSGTPIRTAQAERLPTAEKIIEKLGKCAAEFKFDGFRCQIHIKSKKEVSIFSRNLENTTHMFPDVVKAAKRLKVKEVILDGEAIGFSPKTGKFLPFQETVQRKRKHDVSEFAIKIPLKVFCFDCLFFQGKSLLLEPFSKRREILEKIIPKKGDTLELAPQRIISTPFGLKEFFKESIGQGLEGLVTKKLDSVYQAGARNFNWVKYKRATEGELLDTLDCLVMGYYKGKGKRASFGIGAFLAGVLDPKKGKFLTIAKIGTGLTDEQWVEMRKLCDKIKVIHQPKQYLVEKNLAPDIWTQPQIVVEIGADEITRSPVHTAGRVLGPSKSGTAYQVKVPGFALRFPRLISFRSDKSADQVTTLPEVETLFAQEVGKKK